MIADQWPDLLHSWSRHILATGDYRDYLPEEVIDKQNLWIGYPGAGEEQIAQAEARLKTRLPESSIAPVSRPSAPLDRRSPVGDLYLTS